MEKHKTTAGALSAPREVYTDLEEKAKTHIAIPVVLYEKLLEERKELLRLKE